VRGEEDAMFRRGFSALTVAAFVVLGATLPAAATPKDKQPVYEFASGSAVTGAFSMLDRSADAVATKIRTTGHAGHVYTVWYVIFNAPQNCSGGACGEDDIFNADGSFNAEQIEAARVSVVSGQDGDVANPAGRVQLDGGLAEGEIPDGPNRVVIGRGEDGALVPLGVVTGLEDSAAAEIHIVLQDHGTAHEDQELLEAQLTQFAGACNPDCIDAQFAVHQP
jgi:hypothetical protein